MAQLLRHKDAQACHAKLRNSKSIIYLKAVDTVPPASPDDAMPYVVVAAILVCALALVLSRSPPSRCLRPITNGASAGRMGVEIARQGALRLQKLKCQTTTVMQKNRDRLSVGLEMDCFLAQVWR